MQTDVDFWFLCFITGHYNHISMKLRNLLFIAILACITVSWFPKASFWKKQEQNNKNRSLKEPAYLRSLEKLKEKAQTARKYVAQKGYNQQTAFFIEMGLASGANRFFIYDLQRDSIMGKGLVTHGNCFEYWLDGRRYSNVVGSGCTSLGRYKIGIPYTGKWGYSYKLHGLDSTNSNAYERTVVLHSHSCVPESETTDEICQSNGCTTVAPGFLNRLKGIINGSKKPMLLWIYE